jgi:hypothetical protein
MKQGSRSLEILQICRNISDWLVNEGICGIDSDPEHFKLQVLDERFPFLKLSHGHSRQSVVLFLQFIPFLLDFSDYTYDPLMCVMSVYPTFHAQLTIE